MIRRRLLLGSGLAAAGTLAVPSIVRAQGKPVKMGCLRLVHSMPPFFYEKFAGESMKIEIVMFDSPTDCKNAVVTKSVDFGPFGIGMGGLNMISSTHEETVAKNPDLVKAMLKTHRQAAEFMSANTQAVIDATVQKLGASRGAVEQALGAKNVEYVWKLDDKVQGQARTYAQHMLDLKQIRALPKFETF